MGCLHSGMGTLYSYLRPDYVRGEGGSHEFRLRLGKQLENVTCEGYLFRMAEPRAIFHRVHSVQDGPRMAQGHHASGIIPQGWQRWLSLL